MEIKDDDLKNTQENFGKKQADEADAVNDEIVTKKQKLELPTKVKETQIPLTPRHQNPKKRLELKNAPLKDKYMYGNYSQYYGYRNKGKGSRDVRLDVFATKQNLFCGKEILDIGSNNGYISMKLAKEFPIKSIIGLDIDRSLIKQAQKQLVRLKKALPLENKARCNQEFPYNVNFVQGNYVLRDDVLLEVERPQFDVILCLSITKWIQLNFGDAGLKQAFRRIFLQLRGGGKLILEAQPFSNYGRRKKINETIFANYKAMQFLPEHFAEYLLSAEVGFQRVELMGVPEHCAAGFKRPIQIFTKS